MPTLAAIAFHALVVAALALCAALPFAVALQGVAAGL